MAEGVFGGGGYKILVADGVEFWWKQGAYRAVGHWVKAFERWVKKFYLLKKAYFKNF